MSGLSGMSYAAVAAAATGEKKKVDFVYTEQLPYDNPPGACYKTVSDAQKQFSRNDPELVNLDISGDLKDYLVSDADGATVNFHQKKGLKTRFRDLKREVKSLRQEIKSLQQEFREETKKNQERDRTLVQWQVATALIEGLSQKIWLDFTEADKGLLERHMIYDVQTAMASRYEEGKIKSCRNKAAFKVCDTISKDNNKALTELIAIKHRLGRNRMGIAGITHPDIFVSDLQNFIDTIKPSINRSLLMDLQVMEVWSWMGDRKERLFAD